MLEAEFGPGSPAERLQARPLSDSEWHGAPKRSCAGSGPALRQPPDVAASWRRSSAEAGAPRDDATCDRSSETRSGPQAGCRRKVIVGRGVIATVWFGRRRERRRRKKSRQFRRSTARSSAARPLPPPRAASTVTARPALEVLRGSARARSRRRPVAATRASRGGTSSSRRAASCSPEARPPE
jgi:hypothetical protein